MIIGKNAESVIRQFPSNPNVYSIMDETLGESSVFSFTVTRITDGDYSCICEEFTTCSVCRHSLAVAKMRGEEETFLQVRVLAVA